MLHLKYLLELATYKNYNAPVISLPNNPLTNKAT